MSKRKSKLLICIPCLLLAILFPITVFAAENKVIEEKVFTTTAENYSCFFSPTIDRNGQEYRLNVDSVTYTIVSQQEINQTETIEEKRHFEHLQEQDVDQELTISKNGQQVVLKLRDVQYSPVTFDTGQSISISGTTNYGFLTEPPNADQTKNLIYYENGIQKTMTAPLTDIVQQTAYRWQSGYTIQGKYYGDADCKFYQFGSFRIPNTTDGSVPYIGFQDVILQALNLPTGQYQIERAEWDGDATTIDGVTVRNAVFHCRQYTARFLARYETSVAEQIAGYNADAIYSVDLQVPTGEKEYTVKATAEYVKNNPLNATIITVGVLILILVMVGLLFLLKHRRKKEQE